MASQLQELATLLPGGTYISFTVLAQLTTNATDMSTRLMMPECHCPNGVLADPKCTSAYVCGAGYYEMSIALVVVSAFVVCTLAWYGADLASKKDTVVGISEDQQRQRASMRRNPAAAAAATAGLAAGCPGSGEHPDASPFQEAMVAAPPQPSQTTPAVRKPGSLLGKVTAAAAGAAASSTGGSSSPVAPPKAFVEQVKSMNPAQLRRKYAELVIHQFIRAFGSVLIFLVLALFTPPISTCLLPPCHVPSVVCTVVPLLVSFAISAFVAVQKQFVHRLVFFWDYLLYPADREPARWSILTTGATLLKGLPSGPGQSPV